MADPTRHMALEPARRIGAEQVQRADDLLTQPHRQGLHRGEPGLPRGGHEPRPARCRRGQVRGLDGLADPEAVQARTLIVLQLEQLKQPGGLVGGGHHAQLTTRVSSSSPAADTSSNCTLRSVSTCRKSIMSNPATIVSVSSTNVSDSSSVSIPLTLLGTASKSGQRG